LVVVPVNDRYPNSTASNIADKELENFKIPWIVLFDLANVQ
jgi:hypothetical protein